MIYPYECNNCSSTVEHIRPSSMHTHCETCQCGGVMRQVFSIQKPIVDDMEATYYTALGTVVKSKRHRSELMKRHGLIEVGNERPATIHKEMNNQLQSRLKKYED